MSIKTDQGPTISLLDERYAAALEDYLREADEVCLHRAYELGRTAVRDGRSILEMIELNSRAVTRVLSALTSAADTVAVVEAASVFFKEAMSPYEMTNRAFGEANAALQHLNEALEAQVKRIASALHDEAGQLLAVVHLKLEDVGRTLPAEVREQLQGVRQVLDQIESQLRGLAHELRPPVLDDRGLLPALEDLASAVFRRTGLRVTVESSEYKTCPKKIEAALYRIIQEAVTNASRHAQARTARVRLAREGQNVCCSVADDGIGFNHEDVCAGRVRRGLGLIGIRERLQILGGVCEIQSTPGQGTTINVTLPVEN
jgi:signal transduction histidine kinase